MELHDESAELRVKVARLLAGCVNSQTSSRYRYRYSLDEHIDRRRVETCKQLPLTLIRPLARSLSRETHHYYPAAPVRSFSLYTVVPLSSAVFCARKRHRRPAGRFTSFFLRRDLVYSRLLLVVVSLVVVIIILLLIIIFNAPSSCNTHNKGLDKTRPRLPHTNKECVTQASGGGGAI